jgi:hypothetical protein
MMKNFMISGSFTWGMVLNEDPGGSVTMPFLGDDVVYDGRPTSGRRRVSNLSPGTPTRCGWGPRKIGV